MNPRSDLHLRVGRLRQVMQDAELDALIVNHPANRRYLSGIPASDPQLGETPGWLVIGNDNAYALISSSNYAEAREQAPHLQVRELEAPIARIVAQHTAGLINQEKWRRIGFEATAMSFFWYEGVRQALDSGRVLLPQENLVEGLRVVKDEREVKAMSRAGAITAAAFTRAMEKARAGMTELELAWELEKAVRELGGDGLAFETIVAAGAGAAVPHHTPEDRPIAVGESVIIDMGASVDGYASDMTRTICLGQASPKLKAMHQLVEEALAGAVAHARAGATGADSCQGSDQVMSQSPYHDPCEAGIGHSIGLAVHEPPDLKRDQLELKSGMIFAIEPSAYISGWGGVRLEDTVLVTPEGGKRLTPAAFRLEW